MSKYDSPIKPMPVSVEEIEQVTDLLERSSGYNKRLIVMLQRANDALLECNDQLLTSGQNHADLRAASLGVTQRAIKLLGETVPAAKSGNSTLVVERAQFAHTLLCDFASVLLDEVGYSEDAKAYKRLGRRKL